MYNRYIPQPDGSYRRNPMPEQQTQQPRQAHRASSPPSIPPQGPPPPVEPLLRSEPVPAFLRQLLPQGFDTGDLIIVLLLLLIAGDSQESRGNALLTLALYFIL